MYTEELFAEQYADAFANDFLTNVAPRIENNKELSIEDMEIALAALPTIAEGLSIDLPAAPIAGEKIDVDIKEQAKPSASTIGKILSSVSYAFRMSFDKVWSWIKYSWNKLSGGAKSAWGWSSEQAKRIAAYVKEQTPKVIAKLKSLGLKIWNGVVIGWNWSTAKIKTIVGATWTGLKKAWAFVAAKFMGMIRWIGAQISKAVTYVDQKIGQHVGMEFPYEQVVMLYDESRNALAGMTGRTLNETASMTSLAVRIDSMDTYLAMKGRLAGTNHIYSIARRVK